MSDKGKGAGEGYESFPTDTRTCGEALRVSGPPRIGDTLLPLFRERVQTMLRGGLQSYRRTSAISQGSLTHWISHSQTSTPRLRCWTCLTCRTANLKPSNVIFGSACSNLRCCLTQLSGSIRQQANICSLTIPALGSIAWPTTKSVPYTRHSPS
jgi:hypothetical protein